MPKALLVIFACISFSTCYAQFTYISPVPGSKFNNKESGIILRTGKEVTASSLRPVLFSITGSVSGKHEASIKLAADHVTIWIQPLLPFSAGETVTVDIRDGIKNSDKSMVHEKTFQFEISKERTVAEQDAINRVKDELNESDGNLEYRRGDRAQYSCKDLPPVIVTSVPGAYYDQPCFYGGYDGSTITNCWSSTILSSEGDSIYSYYNNYIGSDFELNNNGYLTYYNKVDNCFDMMDSSYNIVKKFFMGNGYQADKHEFRIYPDGNHFMLCYDQQVVDMTAYGGIPNAIVTGLVVQELDSSNDVIFQWRSWDHFQFTDAANDISLTYGTIDYVHGNSLELDYDGNLLLSSKNMDEITKINLSTGDMIWRMGGKNNQFTFIGVSDTPKPFSHQHDFRRLPNGHYTLFDDGNYQVPLRSSAKEFVLDQVNKTATLVWEYIHPPINGQNVYGSALGSVQVLPNKNRLIDWGQVYYPIPNFTEIDSSGNIVWELRLTDTFYVSYRAHKFPWDRCNLIADSSMIADSITGTGQQRCTGITITKFSGFVFEYKECDSSSWIRYSDFKTNSIHLAGLQPDGCYNWRVQSICSIYNDSFYTQTHQFSTAFGTAVAEPGCRHVQPSHCDLTLPRMKQSWIFQMKGMLPRK